MPRNVCRICRINEENLLSPFDAQKWGKWNYSLYSMFVCVICQLNISLLHYRISFWPTCLYSYRHVGQKLIIYYSHLKSNDLYMEGNLFFHVLSSFIYWGTPQRHTATLSRRFAWGPLKKNWCLMYVLPPVRRLRRISSKFLCFFFFCFCFGVFIHRLNWLTFLPTHYPITSMSGNCLTVVAWACPTKDRTSKCRLLHW